MCDGIITINQNTKINLMLMKIIRWILVPISAVAIPIIFCLIAFWFDWAYQYVDWVVMNDDGTVKWSLAYSCVYFTICQISVALTSIIAPNWRRVVSVLVCLLYVSGSIIKVIEIGFCLPVIYNIAIIFGSLWGAFLVCSGCLESYDI
jgi:hypothetical protein